MLLPRIVLLSLIWLFLTDGNTNSLYIGIPAIIFALLISDWLIPPGNFLWLTFFYFIPFFLMRSVSGGLDVAQRALKPSMPISPKLITYPISLPSGLPSVFMIAIVNLLPGTLIVGFEKGILHVHVLDDTQLYLDELHAVEQWIARMFVITLISKQV